jgi:hypothetical protein
MAQVLTVFRETPFEMPDDEAEVLRRQGLLREDKPGPAAKTDAGTTTKPASPGAKE